VIIGGMVDADAGAALGGRAVREVQSMSVDLCFLGACAVDAGAGVRAFIFEDAEFKRALVESSRAIAVAATAEKLGTTAPFHVLPADELDHLVVESIAAPGPLEAFERLGMQIHQVSG
jgi:DeoR/GlpR family transcriptional regulator of sugar metabolism